MNRENVSLGAKDHDIYQVLSDEEVFADLFNGALFGGSQLIRPEMLAQMNEKKYVNITGTVQGQKKVILKRLRDVQKSAELREGCLAVILAAEGQREIHFAMPVRSMLYDAVDYTSQVEQITKAHMKQKDLKKRPEYLSGLKKEDRPLPVITIVFYYGEDQEWDGPLSLHDMLEIPEELLPWKDYIQDYKVNLVYSGTVNSRNFRTGLRDVFELLPLMKDKEGMKAALAKNRGHYSCMDKKSGWILSKFLNIPELKKEVREGEVIDMCTAIEEMIQDSREEGIVYGVEQGEQKVNRLIRILLEESRQDEIAKAVYDKCYQKKLFDKYGI